MTEKEYNDIKEFERQEALYKFKNHPDLYHFEQAEKEWYRQYYEEQQKEKELKDHVGSKRQNKWHTLLI